MFKISHEKADDNKIKEQQDLFLNKYSGSYLLENIPDVVLILNENRQIVYTNNKLYGLFGNEIIESVYGKRPGDVMNCVHVKENAQGCGSTEFCNECGAFKSIISSINGKRDVRDCRIIQDGTGYAFDLRVYTSPIELNGMKFVMFSVVDISNEKRREVLERIFFHDILNSVIGIKSLMDILEMEMPNDFTEYRTLIKSSAMKLVEEIKAQKQLIAAENSNLIPEYSYINTLELINEIACLAKYYDLAEKVEISIDKASGDFKILTDRTILCRVITNLVKNAVEAEYPNGSVIIGCNIENNEVHFWIKNNSVIPKEVQLQLFQRSFSTKGVGRGIGTYSIKLLTEKYLKGRIDFFSSEEKGTIFNAYYPLIINDDIQKY